MSQSPELAGGEGFTYEGDVAAFYLTALLAEAYAPGIDDRRVIQVSVQQRDFGEPLDDVIIDFEGSSQNYARLSLQVKRALTISSAKSNQDFRDIIRDSWATFKKSDFRIHNDRYGVAVGEIASAKERALKTLCEWARESQTTVHFEARFAAGGNASAAIKTIKADITTLLEQVGKKSACTKEEVHQFIAHFVLIQFDFLHEGATLPSAAINRISDCLIADDFANAALVWSHLVKLARLSAGAAGQFDRARLVRSISSIAAIRGAASYIPDLERLTKLAGSFSNLIPDDIGGTILDREGLFNELDEKLNRARIVQVRGVPGSGKSVVIKRMVQRALAQGPVLFLKAEQLEGTSWISFATSIGLSNSSLTQLLVEIGAAGTPIFLIDAIDRIDKLHQPIILDVLRAITESPLLDNWRVVVSLRDTGIELLRNWLGQFLDAVELETLKVDLLNDDEAELLALAQPHLRPLLFGATRVKEIVRRPFFIKILHQNFTITNSSRSFFPQSEVDLIENWWQRGGYDATGQNVIVRQQALLNLARIHASQLSEPIRISQLTFFDQLDSLKSDGILQDARTGVSVRFAHDIFFEWAFFYVLADRGSQWVEAIRSCGEPPAIARIVELMSQWEYTSGEGWATYLSQTEDATLRSQWQRAWLVGPFGAFVFGADEDRFATIVFANDFRLFRKVVVWFQAEKTAPNPTILIGHSSIPKDQRQQYAYLLGWPSDFAIWRRLISFILKRISDIPQRLYPEVVSIFQVWQNAFADIKNPVSTLLLQQCSDWLIKIDLIDELKVYSSPDDNSEYWKKVPELDAFKTSLVQLLLKSAKSEPSFASEYLKLLEGKTRIRDNVFHDIIMFSPVLSQNLPQSLSSFALAFLRDELPEDEVNRKKQENERSIEHRNKIFVNQH